MAVNKHFLLGIGTASIAYPLYIVSSKLAILTRYLIPIRLLDLDILEVIL